MRRTKTKRAVFTALLVPFAVTGCGWGDDNSTVAEAVSAVEGSATAGQIANAAPTVSGTPITEAPIDAPYDFKPSASDPDGHPLQFSINNKPQWASFDQTTGRLSGTPRANDLGVYRDIIIAVSDGRASTSLGPFSVAVGSGLGAFAGNGTAELQWAPPVQNHDGSPAIDLAGYRVYFGQSPDALNNTTTLLGGQNSRYLVTGLTTGTWYFAVSTVAANGAESELSEIGSKTIG
jgi:Putative Ig domain